MKKFLTKVLSGALALGVLCVPVCALADEDTITVYVSAYDYNAVDGGLSTASDTGVILDTYSVTLPAGSTDVEAITAAFDENNISITILESFYGGYYVREINGLSEYSNPDAEPDYSGWMLEYNDDNFTNYGVGTLGKNGDGVLSDGDVIELHYSLDGGTDLGTVYGGLPVLNSLTVGGTSVLFTKTISYDENWNSIYTFTANGEEMEGDGSAENPFVIKIDAGEVESSTLLVSYSASHYFAVNGLTSAHDFSSPLSFSVSTDSGLTSYFTVEVTYELSASAESSETKDDSAVVVGDAYPLVVLSGLTVVAGLMVVLSSNKKRETR